MRYEINMQKHTSHYWPLPALLSWVLAWAVYLGLARIAPWWLALAVACAVAALASLGGTTWWRRCMMAAGFPLSWMVLSMGQVPAWAWLLPLLCLLLVYPLNAWRDAPVFPTPRGALDALGAQIDLPAGARVLDAGCGAGDGLQALHRAWPQAQVHGVEWSWPLRWISALRCPWARVRRGDLWLSDWSDYAMVYLFQRPESMQRAAVKSLGEMAEGAWLVSLNFPVPDVVPTIVAELDDGREVYAYQTPLAEIDSDSVQADATQSWLPQRPSGVLVDGQALYPSRSRKKAR